MSSEDWWLTVPLLDMLFRFLGVMVVAGWIGRFIAVVIIALLKALAPIWRTAKRSWRHLPRRRES